MKRDPDDPEKGRSQGKKGRRVRAATRVHSKAFRRRIGRSEIMSMSRWLTNRDREICHHIYDHSVLTATQISKLHFTTLRGAEKRLKQLYERRVLDRFQPHVQLGSAPYHYILDELGMRVVAADRGLDLKRVRQRLQTDLDIPARSHLHHQLEVNDFFVTLIKACRDSQGHYEIGRWWSEKRCRDAWKGIIHPDGLGELSCSRDSVTFLLELDRGSERGDRLADKLAPYRRFAAMRLGPEALLFLFSSFERELHARRSLEPIEGLVVATSYRDAYESDPLADVWLPVTMGISEDARRCRLGDFGIETREGRQDG
jgi:Replication-relaxation